MADHFLTETLFSSFKFCEKTNKAIKEMGFEKMTKIQEKTIPVLMEGKDVVVSAKTGSGKTLAFLIPAIERLYKLRFRMFNGTGILIISPTRELCEQTVFVLKDLMKYHSQTNEIIIGGVKRFEETRRLENGANVVVATPGRLLDHLQNTKWFLYKNLQMLIIDEADRILHIGFEEEMKSIVRYLPKTRQNCLFSATLTDKTNELISVVMPRTPMYIGLDDVIKKPTVEGLQQGYLVCPSERRFEMLFVFLKKHRRQKVMVFFNSCSSVEFHNDLFNYIDLRVSCIHGKMVQEKRTVVYRAFCKADKGILLCTDVVARGLDFPDVDWIVQYDPPDEYKEYIHRVGRTARGLRQVGRAVVILRPEELGFLKLLQQERIPLQEYEFTWDKCGDIQAKLEYLVPKNYHLRDSGKEAFVGYVRSFKSHKLKSVYDINTLDLGNVAKSFGFPYTPVFNI